MGLKGFASRSLDHNLVATACVLASSEYADPNHLLDIKTSSNQSSIFSVMALGLFVQPPSIGICVPVTLLAGSGARTNHISLFGTCIDLAESLPRA